MPEYTSVLRSKRSERGRQNFALSYPGRTRLRFLSFLLFCLVQKFSFGFFRLNLPSPSSFATQGQPNVYPGTLTLPDKSENGVRVRLCSCGVLGRFIVALGKGETGPKLRPLGPTFFSVAPLLLFHICLSGLRYGRNDRRLRLAVS